jgi:hypothetical protein
MNTQQKNFFEHPIVNSILYIIGCVIVFVVLSIPFNAIMGRNPFALFIDQEGYSENYSENDNIFTNLINTISNMFSPVQETKNSGKMMALKSSSSNVVIPKFLSSDDNGNLSLFDLDKHTTENDFSAVSLSSLKGDIKVAEGAKLCIGKTCVSEFDLKQILLGDDTICSYKPSQVFNIIANNSLGKTFKNKFTKTSLPASEQTNVSINWGTIVSETPPDNNAKIKQTIYDEFSNRILVRFSKNGITGSTPIFTDANYNKTTNANDVWEPFSEVGTPFIQGSSGLLMQNWKLVDNGGLRFHYDADKNIVAQKTGYDAVSQKFLLTTDDKTWTKSSEYFDKSIKNFDKSIKNIRSGLKEVVYHLGRVRSQTSMSSNYQDKGLFTELESASNSLNQNLNLSVD